MRASASLSAVLLLSIVAVIWGVIGLRPHDEYRHTRTGAETATYRRNVRKRAPQWTTTKRSTPAENAAAKLWAN